MPGHFLLDPGVRIPGVFVAWLPRLAELSSGWVVVEIRELFETAFFGGHR